jgi:hypothetical protein
MACKALLAALVLIVLVPGPEAAPGERGTLGNRPECARAGSETIYASPRVRVYRVHRNGGEQRFACLRWVNRRFAIGRVDADHASALCCFEERHNWLGFINENGTRSVAQHLHWVAVNLRSGVTNTSSDLFHHGWRHGLSQRGTLAWIEQPVPWAGHSGSPVKSVYVRIVGAKRRLLDSGSDIALGSLAVGGRHVYWVKAGQVQSAIVP